MTRITAAIALSALSTCQLPAQRGFIPPVTKSQVEFAQSANSPTQVEWSSDGRRAGYLVRPAVGKPELLIVDAATGQRETARVPDWVTYFHWAPLGTALLLAGDRQLSWLDVPSNRLLDLVTGTEALADAKISPDGRWVAYVRSHNLYVVDNGGRQRAITNGGSDDTLKGDLDFQYAKAFGLTTAYWWAPDSSTIAYLESDWPVAANSADEPRHFVLPGGRLPQMRVFITSVDNSSEGREISLDGTGVYVTRVDWLRDSRHIALERLNREQNEIKLLVAECASGQSHTILTERDQYWVNLPNDLYFFKDGRRLLWSSERSGYRHLYLYGTEGRFIRQITRGDWQIDALSGVDEVHNTVYFTAGLKKPLESQLYRVTLDDADAVPVTKDAGWHTPLLSPRLDRFVDTYSTASTPPRVNLMSIQGDLVANVSNGPAEQGPRPEFLTIRLHDQTPLAAMMIKPSDFDAHRKYPVIVYTHDGPDGRVVQDGWGGWPTVWHQFMAKRGFLILAVDTRGSAGYGHLFEEPIHYRFGAREVADLREVVGYLRGLPFVDPNRLGIWGSGYGGHVVIHTMLEFADGFKEGFADSPITDWKLSSALFSEKYLGLLPQRAKSYDDSNAFDFAWALQGRLLIAANIYGRENGFENVLAIEKELMKKGKSADVLVFPMASHVDDRVPLTALLERMTAFFGEL
jgi:dipeptidyl-peptidase-4